MDVNITKPLLRGLIRIAPGETRCDVTFNSCPTTEWLNLTIAYYSITFNHSVVAVTANNNFTGFHPALITLNHSVVYSNKVIGKKLKFKN
jgi:hypothetical protein